MPFLCAALPKAIGEQKSLRFMAEVKGKVTCRAIALPKPVNTVSLKKGMVAERGTFWLLAHVKDDAWIMVSDKAPLHVQNLVEDNVTDIVGDAVMNTNHEAIRKLYSIAHFQAEISRASIEKRVVNLEIADAMFETCVDKWATAQPKNVLVRWTCESGERVNEIAFKSIIKR